MRFIIAPTSSSFSSAHSTTPHVFFAVQRTSLSSRRPTKMFSTTSTSFTIGKACSVSDLGMLPRSDPIAIKRLKLSAAGYVCISPSRLFHHRPAAQAPLRKSCGSRYGIIRTCSTAAPTVTSSLGPLVLRAPSSLIVTCQLNHSDAPQKSEEWFALRRDKLTTSTFSTALGFWKGNRRDELWQEKVFAPEGDTFTLAAKSAMNWGVLNESAAIERYKSITGRDVSFLGFAAHADEKLKWLGASPDGLLGGCPGGGILEVKCPYNKGKPELGLPWPTVPFYYMPQVQGQMEILDRDWVDLYCWTPNGSTIFRVIRDRRYWELINGILREFWWDNIVPARELMSLGREEEAKAYKPTSTHRQTGLVIVKSRQLAAESELLCKEIAGHIEFFR